MRKRKNQEKREEKNHKNIGIISIYSGMKTIKIVLVCFLFLAVFSIISCDSSKIFEENIEIPAEKWNRNYSAEFIVDINDTNSLQNIYINVRNKSEYQFSNLFLFVNSTAPDGSMIRDTIEYILADNKGKWLGSGLGSVWFNQFPFKSQIKFPMTGQYIFNIEQGMRMEELNSIVDIGLRIEKDKN